MSEIKTTLISGLTETTTVADTDNLIVGGSDAKKITWATILNLIKTKLGIGSYSSLTTTSKELVGAVNELNSKIITFEDLGTISDTKNPLSVAEEMMAESAIRVKIVSVGNVSEYREYAPVGYNLYVIRQCKDTITVSAVHYSSGIIYTNGRYINSDWCGWKKATMTDVV